MKESYRVGEHFTLAGARAMRWGGTVRCLLMASALFLLAPASPLKAQFGEFAVHAGSYERVNTPVTAPLEGVSLPASRSFQLYEVTKGKDTPVASQLEAGTPNRLTWILEGRTAPGTVRSYELRARDELEATPGKDVTITKTKSGEALRTQIGSKPVFQYQYAPEGVPEGVDERYSRGGYIHPLWSPEGEVLTRIQPPDHYHHYGIWNPWTRTEFEGREIDFWNLKKGQGTVRADQVVERISGPVLGGLKALHHHVDLTAPSGEQVVLNEEWGIKVWNTDPDQERWLIDVSSVLHPATSKPLTIKAYRYQGFSLRATEKWNDETAAIRTSKGYDKRNANATRARWINVYGASQAGTSGILFMTNPANHNFPEKLRIWPTGANEGEGNVYINFNPAQDQPWKLKPGNAYALKYRMLVYDGLLDSEQANRYWQDFAHPPRVEVYPTGLENAKVLVYTKNGEGYVHDNIARSIAMMERLGREQGFEVESSDDPSQFTRANLRQYDALVFSNTNNETFDTDAQREALQWYVREGGGVLGIHSASGSERDWPWFSRLMGGNFVRHAPLQDFTATVVDHGHPSTSFLPDRWDIKDDECYFLDELSPRINTVLAADLKTVKDDARDEFPGTTFGSSFPIAWYQQFEGGRQWYTSLGHRSAHYEDQQFERHVLGGLQWVINGSSPP